MYVLLIAAAVVLASSGTMILWAGYRRQETTDDEDQSSRQPTLILCGFMMLALSVTLGATVFWAHSNNVEWNTIKPSSWLISEAQGDADDDATRQAILTLIDRMLTGKLSPAQAGKLLEHYLQVQADPGQMWSDDYGRFIESARGYGLVGEDRWKRYVRQALSVRMQVRKQVRAGGRIPIVLSGGFEMGDEPVLVRAAGANSIIGFDLIPRRYSLGPMDLSWNRLKAFYEYERSIKPDLLERGFHQVPIRSSLPTAPPNSEARQTQQQAAAGLVGPGQHEIKLSYDAVAYDLSHENVPVIDNWVLELKGDVDLVAPEKSTVELVTSDQYRQAIRSAISIAPIRVTGIGDGRAFELSYEVKDAPVDVYFIIEVRIGQRQAPVGFLRSTPGKDSITIAGEYLPLTKGDKVDVILKPAAGNAERTVSLTRIWGENVVVKDVSVR